MKKYVLVLLALAACKTPAADVAAPKPQETATEKPAPAPEKTEAPPVKAEPVPAPPAANDSTPKLLVAIERTPCFGRCPIYRAELFTDGSLVFDGKRFTSMQGRQEAMLTEVRLHEVIQRLESSDFAQWKDAYSGGATDHPTVIITFRQKTIRHYLGSRDAPEALTQLENDLDELLGIKPWISAKSSDR